ncbi:MAG: glycosyltransferase family 2 protein [Chloroflexi bacterium]|nr:glycosyltransferase family 2 protein [Chloroflexota bacterium]
MTTVPDLTIVMCAFNEAARIPTAMEDVLESLRGRGETAEVIVLDNGSTDGTREWLANLRHPAIRVVLNETNIGKGGSIKRGFALSSGRYVVIHDPDLEYRASGVWQLYDLVRAEKATVGFGSRVLGGDVQYRYFANYLGVRALAWAINVLYRARVSDPATAMKLFDGELARRIRLDCSGFDLDFEVAVRALRLGHQIVECRVDYDPRTRAEGKKLRAWRDGILALRAILRDRLLPRSRFTRQTVSARQVAWPAGDP